MRINIILLGFAIAFACLIGFAFYASGMEIVKSIIVGVFTALYFSSFMAVSIPEKSRPTVLIRIVGVISTIVMLVINILFNISEAGNTIFYIINLIIVLISLLIMYGLSKAKI